MIERIMGEDWEVAALRLSTFSNVQKQPNIDNWWETGIQLVPEVVTQERQKASIKYETSYENGKLVFTYQPTRIDWVYEFVEKAAASQSKFATLGQFEEKVQCFRSIMNNWLNLPDLPEFKRMALVLSYYILS
ncbi:MAG: hypothetical protein Q9P01_06840 [Anaerolineae bacterium]|nr:hypothetical protein [Anaerolineae bacterium]